MPAGNSNFIRATRPELANLDSPTGATELVGPDDLPTFAEKQEPKVATTHFYNKGRPDDFAAYNAATKRLTDEAATELAAASYASPPTVLPKNHELRFCFPAPRVAMYRDLLTGEDIVLRRDKGTNTFSKIGEHGWEPWLTPEMQHGG
jgi:hypothetical protein